MESEWRPSFKSDKLSTEKHSNVPGRNALPSNERISNNNNNKENSNNILNTLSKAAKAAVVA